MARFKYTRTIEKFYFKPPSFIDDEQFIELKDQIEKNPNAPLIKKPYSSKGHDRMTVLVFCGVLMLVIGVFGMLSTDYPPAWSVIFVAISTIGILAPLVLTGNYQSSLNEHNAEQKRMEYFNDLKKIVEKSADYQTFINSYRNLIQSKYRH